MRLLLWYDAVITTRIGSAGQALHHREGQAVREACPIDDTIALRTSTAFSLIPIALRVLVLRHLRNHDRACDASMDRVCDDGPIEGLLALLGQPVPG